MIIAFEADHLLTMDLKPMEAARLEADPAMFYKIAALASYGTGVTFLYNDVILGIIGYLEMWPGVFEVWAFPSIYVDQYPVVYLRKVKRYLQALEKSHNIRRLQTVAFADEIHNGWMAFLGFECETPQGMKQHSVLGETFNMWSKVYESDV